MLGCCILPPPKKVLDQVEVNNAGVSSKIQLPEALDDLLKLDGLNASETDAGTHDCGSK